MQSLAALDSLLLRAQRPARYLGGEVGSVRKDLRAASLRFALAFPDTYEVGMSNLGFRLLYHLLNGRPEIACERVFLPWPDLEALIREAKLPLFTLESRAPVSSFDVLGVTLQFELSYTSVLALLDLSRIPLLSRERGDSDPLGLGGGPCAFNPEPVADFFDAFAIGDGEEVSLEIADVVTRSGFRRGGASRAELLRTLAKVPGVYVPSLFIPRYDSKTGALAAMEPMLPGYETVTRRIVPDLNALDPSAYTRPLVPFMQTIHDRLPIEIQRGCTRGCRFCQAGMVTRPTRQRDPRQVLALAESGLRASGYEEIGFLSLSSGDYACLNPLIDDFLLRFEPEKIAMSLPSLRTETLSPSLAERIARIRKTGFTLAPEAGTERMRAIINKRNSDEDLLRAVESIFSRGWSLLKLYFMIGLPGERDEDVVAIADLARRSLAVARRTAAGKGASIHLAVSTFIPKPFTPFQWEPMIPPEEMRRRQALIASTLGGRQGAIRFKPHDSRQTSVEGALARGDRRVGTAILAAYDRGQRLDGWTEHFVEARWLEAFGECEREHGVGLEWFAHRERAAGELLPWRRIDCGVSEEFLLGQLQSARDAIEEEDCVEGPCSACGVCDFKHVKNKVYELSEYVSPPPPPARPRETPVRSRLRVRYSKLGRVAGLSHLETMHALLRAVRRAGLPLAFSQGFHPKPRVSFGPALPVGVESLCEHMDLELLGLADPTKVATQLGPTLPEGFHVMEAALVDPREPSVSETSRVMHYRVEFTKEILEEFELEQLVAAFEGADRAVVTRAAPPRNHRGKGRQKIAEQVRREIDLKSIVTHLAVEGPGTIVFSSRVDPSGSAKPAEVLAAIFGERKLPEGVKILKEGVSFARTERAISRWQPRAPRYIDA